MHTQVQPIAVPRRRFSHIHVDIVGPLPTTRQGFTHLLTAVDRSTRWVEAFPLSSTTAASCATAPVDGWISRFGVPAQLTSDRGNQFTGAVWADLCSKLGINHRQTTAYHPQSNRMVERVHRQIKDALRSRECGPQWTAHLPWVLMGLRAAPKEESAVSSAELVYGCPLVLPGQFQQEGEEIVAGEAIQPPTPPEPHPTRKLTYAEMTAGGRDGLQCASHVYVRRGYCGVPLTPLYNGPYRFLRRGPKSFDVAENRDGECGPP